MSGKVNVIAAHQALERATAARGRGCRQEAKKHLEAALRAGVMDTPHRREFERLAHDLR